MTTLEFVKKLMPSADLGDESSLPPFSDFSTADGKSGSRLDEDDELFINFGTVPSSFPYRMQDNYTRELTDREYEFAVLENEYLRAEFLPDYGGKLWSLVDKKTGRDLLFANPVVRPCNLAVRNAWTSGGVEWNCGYLGHHPHTCSRLYTAVTTLGADIVNETQGITYKADTPVLRMYEYERVRGAVYQMDFFLPDGSPVLLCRMRIVNPNPTPVPMYWWSNMAVPEYKEGRVLVPADETYTSGAGGVVKIDVPVSEQYPFDITRYVNLNHAVDFFFKLRDDRRRYEASIDEGGFGLIQCSTRRLKGRKLFTWGQGQGGDRWQEYLSGLGCDGRYIEIQAGLACSQFESLPMPARTAWEWVEAYGALSTDPSVSLGDDWAAARAETETKLEALIPEAELEKLLSATKPMALTPAAELRHHGSGWGALENLRREKAGEANISPHLDFGEIGEEQEQWKTLLETDTFGARCPKTAPESYISAGNPLYPAQASGDFWLAKAEKAAHTTEEYSWYSRYQYGVMLLSIRRFAEARTELERSMELKPNPWALYSLARLAGFRGEYERASAMTVEAAAMAPDDISLVKAALKAMTDSKKYSSVTRFVSELEPEIAALPRIRLYLANALVKTGRIDEADALLHDGGGLVVADIREGETSITEIWYEIEEAKAKRENRPFDRASAKPPVIFDFRMH